MEQSEKRSYEHSPWINIYDWQLREHENHETGDKFWSVKLSRGTFIEHDGQKLDVSQYRFTTNVKPALTHGEEGTPKAMRGIHFPDGWEITLQRIENVASEGHPPVFEETGRIEKVSVQELAQGIAERNEQWRLSHRNNDKNKNMEQATHEEQAQSTLEESKKTKREPAEMSL